MSGGGSSGIRVSEPHAYEKAWRCVHCGSENVSLAVEWAQSVEPVDQSSDELMPLGSGPGDPSYLLWAFCDDCDAQSEPYAGLERGRVRV